MKTQFNQCRADIHIFSFLWMSTLPLFINLLFYLALKTRQQIPSHKVTFPLLFSHFDFYDEDAYLVRDQCSRGEIVFSPTIKLLVCITRFLLANSNSLILPFENVDNFNYLGSILNADNKINIEIAERIVKDNKEYYANAKLIKSIFLNGNTKMKIYETIIRPVVTY